MIKTLCFKSLLDNSDTLDYNIWTNVNEVGSSNVIHTHTTDAWSGIYYVQAENWKSSVHKSSKSII